MKKFKKLGIFLLIASVAVTILVLSSCTINVTPAPTPTSQTYTIFDNSSTGWLNCAGVWEDGKYVYGSFSLPQAATLEIEANASVNNLPPSDFDIYILTQSQYNNYYQIWYNDEDIGNASSLYEWDLTQYYNNILGEYDFDETTDQLPAGNYYIVVANNYYQFGRGAYGLANFSLTAYY